MSQEQTPNLGRFVGTPDDALGPTVQEKVLIEGRTFLITRPDAVDRLLDHPAIQAAFGEDEYMPYWADLWPAARMLAKAILREPWPKGDPPPEALEVGCGLGLPGIAALAAGLRVIFSDYDATALRFAADNARTNGFSLYRTLHLDWRSPPADLKVPVLLAADVVYELRSVTPLVEFIRKVLVPGGVCLLTDSDRWPSTAFRKELGDVGLPYTTKVMHAGMPGRRVRGTLYRITLPDAASSGG